MGTELRLRRGGSPNSLAGAGAAVASTKFDQIRGQKT